MNCVRCDKRVERPREAFVRPTCYACLAPPVVLEVGCRCSACVMLRRHFQETRFARITEAVEMALPGPCPLPDDK